MIDLSMYPRCAGYLKAMRVKPEEQGMTEYFAAVCIAESFPEKALKKFGGINFHVMKGPALLAKMEQFLEYRSKPPANASKKLKGLPTARITADEIEAAKSPKGGWKRETLAQWGVPWPPPKGWKDALIKNGIVTKPSQNDPCTVEIGSP